MRKKNIGSTFDSWLREEGLYEKVSATAIKGVVARQVEAAMQQRGLTKVEMAPGCAPAVRRSTGSSIPTTMPSLSPHFKRPPPSSDVKFDWS
jgi:hypothetical protein